MDWLHPKFLGTGLIPASLIANGMEFQLASMF
jgi:hypothetical protein